MMEGATSVSMETVNVHEAKTHLSKLIERVRRGEEIVIAKAGRPMVRLVPVDAKMANRLPGTAKGQVVVAPDFDAPLPADLQQAFER